LHNTFKAMFASTVLLLFFLPGVLSTNIIHEKTDISHLYLAVDTDYVDHTPSL